MFNNYCEENIKTKIPLTHGFGPGSSKFKVRSVDHSAESQTCYGMLIVFI